MRSLFNRAGYSTRECPEQPIGRVVIGQPLRRTSGLAPSLTEIPPGQSVTTSPAAGAKFRQELLDDGAGWHAPYPTLRNPNGGFNGCVKDAARKARNDPGQRRAFHRPGFVALPNMRCLGNGEAEAFSGSRERLVRLNLRPT